MSGDDAREYCPIVCPVCGVGCNTEIVLEDGRPVKVVARGRNPDLNGKFICIKGLIVADLLEHPDRLRAPLHAVDGEFTTISWDTAIEQVSSRVRAILDAHGPDAVGMLVSGKITNEEAYLAQKFARTVVRTNNVDTCARLCHSPSEVGLRMQFGYGAVSAAMEDFKRAEVVMLVGANTRFTHPGVWNILRKRKDKTTLVVADIHDAIASADLRLSPRPETDLVWLNGLCKVIVDAGWHDRAFINQRTIGFEAFRQGLAPYTPERVEELTGISPERLEQVARLIAHADTLFVWGMGLTQHANGTDAVVSLGNLALLTGNVGRPGTGLVPLRGQNNVQGAVDMGNAPFTLPGGYEVEDPGARSHFEGAWGVSVPRNPGLSATEMFHQIPEGKIKALFVIGENPAASEPQSAFVRWMLRSLDLLVVQDLFLTETTQCADFVFPAATIGEKDGTTTNAHRRVQYSTRAVPPPGEARPDWQVLQALANALGHAWSYASTEDIWNEIRAVVPLFRGITHARLKASHGLFWPIYTTEGEGARRLYEERFAFRDGRARFFPVTPPSYFKRTTREFPLWLVTHRLYEQFNTGVMTRRSTITNRHAGEGYVVLHEADVEAYQLVEGGSVRISSPFGSLVTRVKIVKGLRVPRGYIFAPIHFSHDANFNELTSTFPLDAKARMPSLKKIPVRVERATQ